MKKIDVGQTITILANVGVIAGILFLAVELQQNNRLLASQAEFNYVQYIQSMDLTVLENPELADLLASAGQTGEELSAAENLQVVRYLQMYLNYLQWRYLQNQAGALDELDALERAVQVMSAQPQFWGATPERFSLAWTVFSLQADPEFVQFFEEIAQIQD